MEKKTLRNQLLSFRATYPLDKLRAMSFNVARNVVSLREFVNSRIVSTYVGKVGEVETQEIISTALRDGKTVIVPKTIPDRSELIFSRVLDMENDLAPGTMGILEPRQECVRPLDLNEADIILVPAIAWDIRGYRLGYGKGYYDKALASVNSSARLVGLSFEFQLLPKIPKEKHDVAVHMIVTEGRIIECR